MSVGEMDGVDVGLTEDLTVGNFDGITDGPIVGWKLKCTKETY